MRLPRDVSGTSLAQKLSCLGYEITRQTGSHIRLSTEKNGQHHITIPAHKNLRVGTLNSIVTELTRHFKVTKESIIELLFS